MAFAFAKKVENGSFLGVSRKRLIPFFRLAPFKSLGTIMVDVRSAASMRSLGTSGVDAGSAPGFGNLLVESLGIDMNTPWVGQNIFIEKDKLFV